MSPTKIGAIWLDNHKSLQPIPSNGFILSKHVSIVFSSLVQVSTSSSTIIHVLALLYTSASSHFMDQDFALTHKITLEKLPCPTLVLVIDYRPIASGNIVEECEPIRVVLEELACVISFIIISSFEHPIVLGLPLFELRNPKINW